MNGIYPNNPFGMYNPYLNQLNNNSYVPNYQIAQPQAPRMEVNRVNGKESAYAFAMGPNSSVVLVDNIDPKIWLVTTDASGYKMVKGFRITPDDEEEPIKAEGKIDEPIEDPIKKLSERIERLEERMSNHGKPNYQSSGKSKPAYTNSWGDASHGKDGEGSNDSNS